MELISRLNQPDANCGIIKAFLHFLCEPTWQHIEAFRQPVWKPWLFLQFSLLDTKATSWNDVQVHCSMTNLGVQDWLVACCDGCVGEDWEVAALMETRVYWQWNGLAVSAVGCLLPVIYWSQSLVKADIHHPVLTAAATHTHIHSCSEAIKHTQTQLFYRHIHIYTDPLACNRSIQDINIMCFA